MARIVAPVQKDADPLDLLIGGPFAGGLARAVRTLTVPPGMTVKAARRLVESLKNAGRLAADQQFKFVKTPGAGKAPVAAGLRGSPSTSGAKFLLKEEDLLNRLLNLGEGLGDLGA